MMEVLNNNTMSVLDVKTEVDSMRESNKQTTNEYIKASIQQDISTNIKKVKADQAKVTEITGQGAILNILA